MGLGRRERDGRAEGETRTDILDPNGLLRGGPIHGGDKGIPPNLLCELIQGTHVIIQLGIPLKVEKFMHICHILKCKRATLTTKTYNQLHQG